MDGHETGGPPGITEAEGAFQRYVDHFVAFRWLAALGALAAAIAPAVMATADGTNLRGSVSAYWDVDPSYLFWAPFTAGAVLLFFDGVLSFVSPNRRDFGGRWYNVVLGTALVILTWFNVDDHTSIHYPAAMLFFGLFIAVICYTSLLGWVGEHVLSGVTRHNKEAEVLSAKVSFVFLLLLVLTLLGWLLGLVSFFFFELFGLVNFALYYVQASVSPFPFNHYQFPSQRLNSVLRRLLIMRPLIGEV